MICRWYIIFNIWYMIYIYIWYFIDLKYNSFNRQFILYNIFLSKTRSVIVTMSHVEWWWEEGQSNHLPFWLKMIGLAMKISACRPIWSCGSLLRLLRVILGCSCCWLWCYYTPRSCATWPGGASLLFPSWSAASWHCLPAWQPEQMEPDEATRLNLTKCGSGCPVVGHRRCSRRSRYCERSVVSDCSASWDMNHHASWPSSRTPTSRQCWHNGEFPTQHQQDHSRRPWPSWVKLEFSSGHAKRCATCCPHRWTLRHLPLQPMLQHHLLDVWRWARSSTKSMTRK